MIDNVTSTLLNSIKDSIDIDSKIYVQCNQVTFLAIAELISTLEEFNAVQFLVHNEEKTIKSFSNIESDFQVRNDLKSLLKANEILDFSRKNVEFRNGFYGVNSIIIEGEDFVQGFIYTHDTLNTQVLGLTPGDYVMIVADMSEEQSKYLLFNNLRYYNTVKYPSNSSYSFPIKLKISSPTPEALNDSKMIRKLIEQVYQFSRLYWKSLRQQNVPITIKYPEMVAEIAPRFESKEIPPFGQETLWFL